MNTVLHTIDTWGPGGAETVCVELAHGLDRARFRSCAAVVREGWVFDALRERAVDTTITPIGRGSVDLGYLWRLGTLARRRRASVIQSHLLGANLYSSVAARAFGIPAVATFHGMVDVAPNDRWAATKLKLIASNVHRLVFVSDALRRHFHDRYQVPDDRTVVIPNGIDTTHFHPAPNRALRQELGATDDQVIVGAVGNIRTAKGYDDLLRVAAILCRERPNLLFAVVGEPGEPLYGQLLAQRQELGLDDRVRFLGFRADIAQFLNGIDLYVSTSTSEGFSLTTIQAMASGLAVVATRSGGPDEIITDGKDGVLTPVADPPAIASAIAALVDDSGRRRQLGLAGRDTVLGRFSLSRMLSAYETIYEDAIAARS
jgi:glycosyltransferase involved in cell wall biosynthesis